MTHKLRRELADLCDAYPPTTWSPQMLQAFINLLRAYSTLRETELNLDDTRPLPILRTVGGQ